MGSGAGGCSALGDAGGLLLPTRPGHHRCYRPVCREGTRQPGLFPQQALWHRRRNEGSPSLIILITNICHGIGWVCENQPEQAWDKEIGCDCGAGMPCKCNSGEEPDISQVIEENPPTSVHRLCDMGIVARKS